MQVDIKFSKSHDLCTITFSLNTFKAPNDFSQALEIIFMAAGDFQVDAELTTDDLKAMIEEASSNNQSNIVFEISEDGIEGIA